MPGSFKMCASKNAKHFSTHILIFITHNTKNNDLELIKFARDSFLKSVLSVFKTEEEWKIVRTKIQYSLCLYFKYAQIRNCT
jgi:hypothetical protein